MVVKERKNKFEISRISYFRYHTRYFSDSGIIRSKEFVPRYYQRFKTSILLKARKKAQTDQRLGNGPDLPVEN
jgi:hypothetical protein